MHTNKEDRIEAKHRVVQFTVKTFFYMAIWQRWLRFYPGFVFYGLWFSFLLSWGFFLFSQVFALKIKNTIPPNFLLATSSLPSISEMTESRGAALGKKKEIKTKKKESNSVVLNAVCLQVLFHTSGMNPATLSLARSLSPGQLSWSEFQA